MGKLRRLGMLPVALVAIAVVALTGCEKAVEKPLSFATADPRIEIPTVVVGLAIADVMLPEASGGSERGELTYSLTPAVPGLTFDAAARVLSGIPTEAGTYTMTYTATDIRSKTTSLSFTITVVDGLSFGSVMLPARSLPQDSAIPTVGLPPAVGGTGAVSYRLTPVIPGLTFDAATRELSGTPTTPGTYPMTYEATDSAQATATLSFTIAIVGFGRTTLDDVTYDQDSGIDSLTLSEATGGTFTYSLTPDVPGLTFNAATRNLSGTPTRAGMYRLTYSATDALGTVASLNLVVTVRPSFRGTWTATFGWYGDDGHLGTFVDTLTFTKERYILYRAHYLHDGTFDHPWTPSGTWTPTGSNTVTRIWLDNHDDDDDTPDVRTSISKNYTWGDESRELLLMHDWTEDEEKTHDYTRYTRLEDPLRGGLTGTWIHHGSWDHGELGEVQQTLTFMITIDTFTEVDRNVYPNGDVEINTRFGSLTIDQENQFLKVAVTSASLEWNGEPDEDFDDTESVGHEFRYGYAESGQPDKLSVSMRWEEQDWNHETMMYENSEEFPYGNYQWLFTRFQEAR